MDSLAWMVSAFEIYFYPKQNGKPNPKTGYNFHFRVSKRPNNMKYRVNLQTIVLWQKLLDYPK